MGILGSGPGCILSLFVHIHSNKLHMPGTYMCAYMCAHLCCYSTDWVLITARFEFEDKKEYLNELSKQQFDLAATTHYTTNRSEVRYTAYRLLNLACRI